MCLLGGGRVDRHASQYAENCKKVVKSWLCYKSVGYSVFPWLLLVIEVGHMAKTPLPSADSISPHHWNVVLNFHITHRRKEILSDRPKYVPVIIFRKHWRMFKTTHICTFVVVVWKSLVYTENRQAYHGFCFHWYIDSSIGSTEFWSVFFNNALLTNILSA